MERAVLFCSTFTGRVLGYSRAAEVVQLVIQDDARGRIEHTRAEDEIHGRGDGHSHMILVHNGQMHLCMRLLVNATHIDEKVTYRVKKRIHDCEI